MHEVAADVWHIPLTPRDGINAYLVGDVLVDAGVRASGRRLVAALRDRRVCAHALTHAHGDHAGGSRAVAGAFDVPVWAGARDAAAVQAGRPEVRPGPVGAVLRAVGRWPPVPVARHLREGDEIGHGFVVLDTPGHSPGHVSFWREADRVLLCGDVFFGMDVRTTIPGVREPIAAFTVDPPRNRASERRLAELDPAVVLFGHGPVLRDPAAVRAFVAALPAEG